MIEWLRYVVHSEIEKYKALGWEISDDLSGTSHGRWSVLMQWQGEGEPDGSQDDSGSRLPDRRHEGTRHERDDGVLVPPDR